MPYAFASIVRNPEKREHRCLRIANLTNFIKEYSNTCGDVDMHQVAAHLKFREGLQQTQSIAVVSACDDFLSGKSDEGEFLVCIEAQDRIFRKNNNGAGDFLVSLNAPLLEMSNLTERELSTECLSSTSKQPSPDDTPDPGCYSEGLTAANSCSISKSVVPIEAASCSRTPRASLGGE